MLALRSILVVEALDRPGLEAARRSAADAVLVDLAAPGLHGQREAARAAARRYAKAIAKAGRPTHARVSDTRSGELDADLDAVVGESTSAVVLSGAEVPQDVRDADVAIRKREMRLSLQPGAIRLIPEVDSAAGLLALPRMLDAVDRHGAVALNIDGVREDLRLGDRATALYEHAMADVAMAARAAGLPWLLALTHHRTDSAGLPTRAHEYGAAGVTVDEESAVRGMNALFALDPVEVAIARAMVAEWERLQKRGRVVGVVAGEVLEAPTYDRLVDRRSVRRARALIDLADAIARREARE